MHEPALTPDERLRWLLRTGASCIADDEHCDPLYHDAYVRLIRQHLAAFERLAPRRLEEPHE